MKMRRMSAALNVSAADWRGGTSRAFPGRRSRIGLAVAAALAGAALPQGLALADAAPAVAAGPAGPPGGGLAEVTVTARKVTENVQDVPISIEVFTEKELKDLGIANMDDYLQKVPSISYISTGPGTQLFVMRGVSDGSDPNYANTASTAFIIDDMSMNEYGGQPDLHLYDIQSIQVLNGPQGTTFGAGAMSGAIIYTTNKPDVNAFSAGADADAGKIQGAQWNQTYEGFVNIPLIDGKLGMRVSGFSVSNGGFINNELTDRTWVNGAMSNNAPWARNDYNRESIKGGRIAFKWIPRDGWDALLTYGFQRQHTWGAWDEDPTLPPRTVSRFGPESDLFETNMVDFHVDGDVGIGDLVFASTYWNQERKQVNEYSQYEQNFNVGAPTGGFPGTSEGFYCQNDPYYGTAYQGCNPALQWYTYNINPQRWSNELRLSSKPGGRFHWLGGLYWQNTIDSNYNNTYYSPGLVYSGAAFQYYFQSYGITHGTLPPNVWYTYTASYWDLQTTEFANINFDVTDKLNVEAGVVHFHDKQSYATPILAFAYGPNQPSGYETSSHKTDGKAGISYKITNHDMVYANWSQGFRPGGSNSGDIQKCYDNGTPHTYSPDTLNNYELGWKTTSLDGRLLWNGAGYYMDWKSLQALIYNALVCPPSSYNINVGDARIYGGESNIDYNINEAWHLQAAVNYTDARVTDAATPAYDAYVNQRLPFAPYFSWSWNVRYQTPVSRSLRGYVQFDMSHKGDMYNGLNPNSPSTGLPRILQPAYTIMNVRLGVNPAASERWFAEFYITNVADKNAIIFSNTGNFDLRLTTNEPRVYGARVSYRWGKGS
jgi:outer membrane receptor protein involved in Fe transport